MSAAEELFEAQLKEIETPAFIREHRFHPVRKWRFDFAWPQLMIACEVEGLHPGRGRHQTIKGYTADCEKYNEAAIMGWLVLRFPQNMVKSGFALETIQRLFNK